MRLEQPRITRTIPDCYSYYSRIARKERNFAFKDIRMAITAEKHFAKLIQDAFDIVARSIDYSIGEMIGNPITYWVQNQMLHILISQIATGMNQYHKTQSNNPVLI